MTRRVMAVWIAALALVLWAGASEAQRRVALVIGNSEYETVGFLPNPRNDASDMTLALEGLGFEVLLGLDLDRTEMAGLIDHFGELAAETEVAMFFYAGHGFQVDGRNYLVPVDARIARPSDVFEETLPIQNALNAMAEASGPKLVFLDACRDNPLGATAPPDLASEPGLARAGTEADFLFAYATQPDNVAYDGDGRNSYFTEAMLGHIYTPGQDIANLLINVRRDVLAATGGRQIPWDTSSLTRQFRFDNSPPTASEETLLWQVAAGAADPELMQLYLDRYPEGTHAGEVIAFLEAREQRPLARTLHVQDDAARAERLWLLARRSRMRPLIDFYLERYPDGIHAGEARQLREAIPSAEDARPGTICERLATHPGDATATTPGVPLETLKRNGLTAIQACSAATSQAPALPHYTALLARAVFASGDHPRALQLYESAAVRGDLRAMVSLAQIHESGLTTERGLIVEADIARALALYEQAAARDSIDAQINLAVALFEGQAIPADPGRAVQLLTRAAENGSAKATYNLGVLALKGVIETPAKALGHFQAAAEKGNAEAYRAVGIMLDQGREVPQDPERAAINLLRGAAEDDGAILELLTKFGHGWSPATLRAIQIRLQRAGLYTATIDGIPGPALSAALERWRNGGFDPGVLVN